MITLIRHTCMIRHLRSAAYPLLGLMHCILQVHIIGSCCIGTRILHLRLSPSNSRRGLTGPHAAAMQARMPSRTPSRPNSGLQAFIKAGSAFAQQASSGTSEYAQLLPVFENSSSSSRPDYAAGLVASAPQWPTMPSGTPTPGMQSFATDRGLGSPAPASSSRPMSGYGPAGALVQSSSTARPGSAVRAHPVETKSLFERLGGTGAISAAVFVFYSKVMADSRIKHFFEGIDMNAQREKQVGCGRGCLFCGLGCG